jgi:predicted TIM-barrel fold metal-dependent hydrolase
MIIDAHTHLEPLADYRGKAHHSYGTANVDVETYLRQMDENGVDAGIAFMRMGLRLESRTSESNDGLARARDRAPDRIYPWGSVHPAWPEKELRGEIRRIARVHGFGGLKFVLIVQGYPLSAEGMDIVAEEAIDLGLPVTLHDGSPEYCSAIQTVYYARKYPQLKVVSAHGGLRELWPDFLDAVGELPNLWLCLSGPTQWAIQTLYDKLGPNRLLFGSDGGLGHPAITRAYLRRIDRLNAPERHKKMILGGNAMSFIKPNRAGGPDCSSVQATRPWRDC